MFCYNGQKRVNENGEPLSYMFYGHVHNTEDYKLVRQFMEKTKSTQRIIGQQSTGIPCNMINCFCMRSNYTPLTLDEWLKLEEKEEIKETE